MKKFRIVALLLVMCLASSCFVGGTFAKYSSTTTSSDSAIVASWSFKFDGTDIAVDNDENDVTFNLFDTILSTGDATENATRVGHIAPGTQGSFEFTVSNKSDVAADWSVSFEEDANNMDIAIEYSPDKTNWYTDIANCNDDGQIAVDGTDETVTIYWRWVFYKDATGDTNDTADGTAAAVADSEFTIKVDFTATQVDTVTAIP